MSYIEREIEYFFENACLRNNVPVPAKGEYLSDGLGKVVVLIEKLENQTVELREALEKLRMSQGENE